MLGLVDTHQNSDFQVQSPADPREAERPRDENPIRSLCSPRPPRTATVFFAPLRVPSRIDQFCLSQHASEKNHYRSAGFLL